MDRHALGGLYGQDLELDLCFACHVMWFDHRESIQLSPRGTLQLFRMLHEHEDDPRHALKSRMVCPRCERRLSLKNDIGKAGRFSYYACPEGHGRVTPFSEFLKEKQFVRSLSPAEQHRLRAELKSVQCSGCGAPIDLVKGFQCGHCAAPITVLDADAVQKTLHELESADRRTSGDPEARELNARARSMMENFRTRPEDRVRGLSARRGSRGGPQEPAVDLLSRSIARLFGGF
jgi:hypothetical protein